MKLRDFYPEHYEGMSNLLNEIGIDAATLTYFKSGCSAKVFDMGHGQVLKIRNKDVSADEWPGAFLPKSRCVLQPICVYDNFAGFMEVALFPKLDTHFVKPVHSMALKLQLEKEGFDFFDDKTANIGLAHGIPYVIDSDAICPLTHEVGVVSQKPNHLLNVFKWPESQWELFPCAVLGANKFPNPTLPWVFDGHYGKNTPDIWNIRVPTFYAAL